MCRISTLLKIEINLFVIENSSIFRRDKFKLDLEKMCARIAQQELQVKQTLDDNQNMRDEMFALKVCGGVYFFLSSENFETFI